MRKFLNGLLFTLILGSMPALGQVTELKKTGNVPVFNSATGKYAVLAKRRNLIAGTKWYWVTSNSDGKILDDSYRYGAIFGDSASAALNIPSGFSGVDPCNLPASWLSPSIELAGSLTKFTIRVSNPNGQIIQFRQGPAGTWNDATIGTGSITFYGPSDGQCQDFYYRAKGCTTAVWGCYLAYDSETPPPLGSNSEIFAYNLETQQNRFNINQFPNVSMPSGHKAILGYGSPAFYGWSNKVPLDIFLKGFSHSSNTSAFTRAQAPDNTQHFFLGASGIIRDIAASITGSYPDAAHVATGNFHLVSKPTAEEIGKRFYDRASAGYDWQAGEYIRSVDGMYYHIDEEQFDNALAFLGNVMYGLRSRNNTTVINLYGKQFNNFYVNDNKHLYPLGRSDGEIISYRDNFNMPQSEYKDANISIDVSGGYFRVPVFKSTIYQKSGDNYVLDGFGKRQLRTDSFTETIFGRTFNILAGPHPNILAANDIYDDPGHRKTDVQWMLQELYLYADYLNIAALNYSKTEFGDYDISSWRNYGKKRSVTFRPRTEPWTYGGNDYRIREIGEYGILYQVLYAYFSGVNYLESWDDGWGGSYAGLQHAGAGSREIKNEGERLYPTPGYSWDNPKDYWNLLPNSTYNENATGDDNYSRYTVYAAAVNSFAKICTDNNYIFNSSLRYIRFNSPVKTFQNKEILATGIYQGGKFSCLFMYPYHDENDSTPIQISFGGQTIEFILVGRSPAVFTWSVPSGVNPADIIIQYNNIDGNHRKMNAVVTGDADDHYVD